MLNSLLALGQKPPIIKKALSPTFSDEVVQTCRTSPLIILCDGGNDQSHQKYFGIMVTYWDNKLKQAVTRFLSMLICNIATAELLFLAIEKEFELHGIPWNNLTGYASDSASVMVGKYNSVLSRLHNKQSKLFSLGCVAAGLKKLPVSLDELLLHIFYHFKHSSKRWHEFNEI